MDMNTLPTKALLGDLRKLIDGARHRAATMINSELLMLYWHQGRRIHIDLLKEERVTYGNRS